jgi:hypothetical protein
MRLYSGRHFQSEVDRDGVLLFYRLYGLTRQWGGPSGADWAALIQFLTTHPGVEAEGKLHILARWSQDQLPADLSQKELQTPLGRRWYRKGIKHLLEKDGVHPPGRRQILEAELARLKDLDR